MDIDRFNFWEKLPAILKTISEAQYVAVDLEMSGIQANQPQLTPVPVHSTLQEVYDDARMAAETFSILQFGFTCISWEPQKKSYVTKTYNLPLHPGVIVDNTASRQFVSVVDRCYRLSTKTLDFLENNDFCLLDVFHRGIPYLSQEELFRKETWDFIQGQRPAKSLIGVGGLPTKSLEFRDGVKDKIIDWRTKGLNGGHPEPVRVYGPHGHRLNGLQKRLVHELLQDHFPELQARNKRNRSGGVYMEISEPCRETSSLERSQRVDAVRKQIGARLLWDAICGQPFVINIETKLILGDEYPFKCDQLISELKKYEGLLRNKSPIVIAHNILMDLCFLHHSFVAHLPDSLREFRTLTRKRMPRLVDTKYLFTRGGDEMSPDYSLSECFAAGRNQELPGVAPDPSHSYSNPCPHQAGYDSYMTAVVFLKKSYQLSLAGEGLRYIASEDLGEGEALRARSASFSSPKPTAGRMNLELVRARDAAPSPPPIPPIPDVSKVSKLPLAPRAELARPLPDTSPNNILEERDEDVIAALDKKYRILQPEGHPTARQTALPTPEQSPSGTRPSNAFSTFKIESSSKSEGSATGIPVPGTVPEWEGQFWSKYGNRSRVGQFGHILYIGKMAGEQLPGDEKTEKPGGEAA